MDFVLDIGANGLYFVLRACGRVSAYSVLFVLSYGVVSWRLGGRPAGVLGGW